jgi:DNA polymerase-3 subunit gamma/tau
MAYQVLARKWRPQNFTQLVGQEHVSQSLCNALQHDRLHHAYLFTGTRGVGKTTVARILAKAINCEHLQDSNPCGECHICLAFEEGRFLDLIEVDAASRTKVEDTRDLLDNVQYAPNQGQYKVYLIDEVHMLSGHSFNALLKTLEEPPPHVKFLLATTDPQKIPVTILSRCLQFNLKRLSPEQIDSQMAYILGQEKIECEPAALKLLSRSADGSMRDGLSLLDQAISFGDGEVKLETVTQMLGIVAQQPVDNILFALAKGDAAELLQKIAEVMELAPDFSDILQQILRVLHRVSLVQVIPDFTDSEFDSDVIAQLASQMPVEDVQLFYQIGLVGQQDLILAPDPRCGFEMVMLRMLTFKPDKSHLSPVESPREVEAVDKKPVQQAKEVPVTVKQNSPSNSQQKEIVVRQDNHSWADMVVAMNLKGMTRELANNCILDTVDDSICNLVIDAGHKHLISPRAKENLQKGLDSYYAKKVKLTITADVVSDQTPTQQIVQKNEDQQQTAVNSINEDENVLALKEHFNARVMPGTIEPK